MRSLPILLVAALSALLLSAATPPSHPASALTGEAVLARAARAYRAAPEWFATVQYVVIIPGAPQHVESQEFGRSAASEAWVRMPDQYVMQVHRGRLYLAEEGRLEPHTESALAAGLQAAIDSAFGGQGPPLAPAPLLLVAALTPQARSDAFRMKLLGPLRVAAVHANTDSAGLPLDEIDLLSENGSVRARFDRTHGWLLAASLTFVPAPGADTIRAEVTYTRHDGPPSPLPPVGALARGRRVSTLTELGGEARPAANRVDPRARFRSLDGSVATLSALPARFIVLEYWASWCAPCRASLPEIARFATWARDSALDVAVRLINTEDQEATPELLRARVRRYLDRLDMRVPCWIDSASSSHRALGSGLPMTVVIEPGGRVLALHSGFRPGLADTLKRQVREFREAAR